MMTIMMTIIIIIFLPLVAYDPEGFQKLDRLQKTTKLAGIIIIIIIFYPR